LCKIAGYNVSVPSFLLSPKFVTTSLKLSLTPVCQLFNSNVAVVIRPLSFGEAKRRCHVAPQLGFRPIPSSSFPLPRTFRSFSAQQSSKLPPLPARKRPFFLILFLSFPVIRLTRTFPRFSFLFFCPASSNRVSDLYSPNSLFPFFFGHFDLNGPLLYPLQGLFLFGQRHFHTPFISSFFFSYGPHYSMCPCLTFLRSPVASTLR